MAIFFKFEYGKSKKNAAKPRADYHEPKIKTDLSFDELIAMSVRKSAKKETPKKK